MCVNTRINESWRCKLEYEISKDYFCNIEKFLISEKYKWKTIFPDWKDIFNAFNSIDFDKVKVVMIWQDPYHWPNQAHWLCFSVKKWVKIPPSLRNIYKELEFDLGFKSPKHWCLQKWADQGVFMLNAILTVESHHPASHSKIGWQKFTDSVIKILSKERSGLVFLLWGVFAQWKKRLIDTSKHYILETAHPSPFSAHKWFYGCRHFSKTNEILEKIWISSIDWNLD